MAVFVVSETPALSGAVQVSGSKNAVLPIICASLLTDETVVLTNVPDIDDITSILDIVASLGVSVKRNEGRLELCAKGITSWQVTHPKAKKIRAGVLLLGALLARFGRVEVPYPGGCVIGKRPVDTHIYGFSRLGAVDVSTNGEISLIASELVGARIIMPEISVTGTENVIIASVLAHGTTHIRLAAREPHVVDLCNFLVTLGAHIEGIGTDHLIIDGVEKLSGGEYRIVPDYIEAGTFVIAGILTNSHIQVNDMNPGDLDVVLCLLEMMGAKFAVHENSIETFPHEKLLATKKLRTGAFPEFPTDLQAPFAVLFTQAHGISKVFETMFENRLNYLIELETMGAHVEYLNKHEALFVGPSKLYGSSVSSWDLRAGAAMVLAGLIAKGTTIVYNIDYIRRGYERFHEKLQSLGACITLKEE